MSRRNQAPTLEMVMGNVDYTSDIIKAMSDDLVNKYCKTLDDILTDIRTFLQSNKEIQARNLEFMILDLANCLYFTGSAQEDLGIKEDICKSIRQEIYNKTRDEATGTVADKNALAELKTQQETIVLNIYSRAYKKVKLRMEAGYEMLNSLKKIMNYKLAEMELSNSRHIGGNVND